VNVHVDLPDETRRTIESGQTQYRARWQRRLFAGPHSSRRIPEGYKSAQQYRLLRDKCRERAAMRLIKAGVYGKMPANYLFAASTSLFKALT
jgi:hypothetical protein